MTYNEYRQLHATRMRHGAPLHGLINMTHQTVHTDITSCDRAEIAEEIMDNLRPWMRPESEVEADIQEAIKSLRKLNSPIYDFNRSAIKKSAQEFVPRLPKLINHGDASIPWCCACYSRGMSLPGTNKAPFNHFLDELERMRIECERLARDPFVGVHPNFDLVKNSCARSALGLMRKFSQQAPTGTSEGPFRTISSLLYQAVSGERLDLKRACDAVLRDARQSSFS